VGFLRYQQVRIEASGTLRELPPGLHSIVSATYRSGDDATAVVTVHHPAPGTVSALREVGAVVEVVAGYIEDGPPPGVIVRGRVIAGAVREVWRRPQHYVEAQVRPADVRTRAVVQARAWETTTGREVWEHVVRSSGMTAGRPPPDQGAVYRRGYSVRGDPSPLLRVIAADAGWRYTTSSGVVDVWGPADSVPLIAPDTGLIDSAERVDDGRVTLRCQLRPDVRPGSVVAVQSRTLGASAVRVRVSEVVVASDSREGAFELAVTGEVET